MTATNEESLVALLSSRGVNARLRGVGGNPAVVVWANTVDGNGITILQHASFAGQDSEGQWWIVFDSLNAGRHPSIEAVANYIAPLYLDKNLFAAETKRLKGLQGRNSSCSAIDAVKYDMMEPKARA